MIVGIKRALAPPPVKVTTRIVSCVLYCGGRGGEELCHWLKSGKENEFVEHEAFIDSVRVKNAESKIFWRVFMAFHGACL